MPPAAASSLDEADGALGKLLAPPLVCEGLVCEGLVCEGLVPGRRTRQRLRSVALAVRPPPKACGKPLGGIRVQQHARSPGAATEPPRRIVV